MNIGKNTLTQQLRLKNSSLGLLQTDSSQSVTDLKTAFISVFKKNPFLNFSPQLTAFFQQNNVSKIQRVPYPNVNVMQTPGLIPNPAI